MRVQLLEASVVEEKLVRKRRTTLPSQITPELAQIAADIALVVARWCVDDAAPFVSEERCGVHFVSFGCVDDDWLGFERGERVFARDQWALAEGVRAHPQVNMELFFIPPIIFAPLTRIFKDEIFLEFRNVNDAPDLWMGALVIRIFFNYWCNLLSDSRTFSAFSAPAKVIGSAKVPTPPACLWIFG